MSSGSLAWFFPGQGSQLHGMALELLADDRVVRDTFVEASDLLGYDLELLIGDDSDGRLHQTQYTQPALLVSSVAMVRWWRAHGGVEPSHVAGHSLGEYSALVAVGAIDFADAVPLVALRGRVMASCVDGGGVDGDGAAVNGDGSGCMAAILGLDDAQIDAVCQQATDQDGAVWPANFNCPGQVVVAGDAVAVARAVVVAKESGAKRAVVLNVSAPSHTPLMAQAAEAVAERLAAITITAPDRALWCNASATQLSDAASVRQALVDQLTQPVRWSAAVQGIAQAGVTHAVEMGPGRVLMGLVRRIDRGIKVMTGDTPAQMAANIEAVGGVV
ncbi:MAG: ACP S-malonyltransferase [Mariprofundales bacterium]|nr:ACP S-malonyltransferase [Mariprofundales bacterium]